MDLELENKRFIIDIDDSFVNYNSELYFQNKRSNYEEFKHSKSPSVRSKLIDDQNCHPNIIEYTDFRLMKISKLEKSIEYARSEIKQLNNDTSNLKREKIILEVKNHSLEEQKKDIEVRANAFYLEIERQSFLNSVLEQKINELSHQISMDRLNSNELLSSKRKKFREDLEKLTKEKIMYEERANAMCAQMTEQMALLQTTAMGRIEVYHFILMKFT